MDIKKIYISRNVIKLVMMYTKDQEKQNKIYESIADKVSGLEKGEFEVEKSDKMLTFNNIPLSFVRSFKTGEAVVMTLGESIALDYEAKEPLTTIIRKRG